FVEMLSQCPTAYGRRTKAGGPVEMLKWMKKLPVRKKGDPMEYRSPTHETIDLGVFVDRNEPSFLEFLKQTISQ
ncbi:MAG: 2-oxoacid:ferredoxin oxidoreductase subunit beta, partial [Candidatus Thorarchaeota archaeon]